MRKVVMIVIVVAFSSAGAYAQVPATQAGDGAESGQFTIGAEALGWRLQDCPLPFPVVTDGILGQSDTHVLLGNQDFDTGTNRGFRISAYYTLGDRSGIEANIFRLAARSNSAGIESSGEPGSTDIFLPYIDATTLQESGTELSSASIYRGSAYETLSNDLQGAELDARWSMSPAHPWHVDLLGGVRYLRLHEAYTLTTQSPYLDAFGPDIWQTTDRFETSNNFYGVQAGLRASFEQSAFLADASAKVAIGAMRQSVGIAGTLVTDDFTFGPAQTFPGGYFALPTNMGQHARTAFSVVPEVALNLGYRLTSRVTIHAGYSFLYASSVVRPGNQVSRIINTSQSAAYAEDPAAALHGVAAPGFSFNSSSFRVQGINVGVTIRFQE